MGTIVDKLTKLLDTKTQLKAALIEQGQTVTDSTPFSEYPDKVRAIQGGAELFDVTITNSKTKVTSVLWSDNEGLQVRELQPKETITVSTTGWIAPRTASLPPPPDPEEREEDGLDYTWEFPNCTILQFEHSGSYTI